MRDLTQKTLLQKIEEARAAWTLPLLDGRIRKNAETGQWFILRKLGPDPRVSDSDRELGIICHRCGASFWGYRAATDLERAVFGLEQVPEYSGGYLIASLKHEYYLTTVAYRCSCPVGCSKPARVAFYDAQPGSERGAMQEDLTRTHWKLSGSIDIAVGKKIRSIADVKAVLAEIGTNMGGLT